MKVFIFPGFDLDNFREANPHLRVELLDATSDKPWCKIMPQHRTGPKPGSAKLAVECIACDARTTKTKARREWYRRGGIRVEFMCPDCYRKDILR